MPVAWWFLRIPPHWSSNKPPAVASDRCLYRLPIILLALNTKQRGKEIVYIEGERRSDQKEQRERVIGSIERRFFSPEALGRFHWKAVAVYRSAFRDGYCEAKDGERKRERGGGIHAERETQRHRSIQLCSRRIRVSERTARNKSSNTSYIECEKHRLTKCFKTSGFRKRGSATCSHTFIFRRSH